MTNRAVIIFSEIFDALNLGAWCGLAFLAIWFIAVGVMA